MYPVRPLLVFCSNLSSRGGKATWLRARSKNKGLQGMGWNPGGKCTRLACLVTREGSRQKVSNRSTRGWKTDQNVHQKAHSGMLTVLGTQLTCAFFQSQFVWAHANTCLMPTQHVPNLPFIIVTIIIFASFLYYECFA